MSIEHLQTAGLFVAALTPPAVAVFRHLGQGLRLTERFLLAVALAPFLLGLPAVALALIVNLPMRWCVWPSEFIWTVLALWPRFGGAAPAPAEPLPERGQGFPAIAAVGAAVGAALLVAGVAFSVPYVRMWSDAWFHAGAATEITIHGVVPQDPNFAGIPFYYPWFFHFLLSMLQAVAGASAFEQMSLINTWSAVVVALAAAQLAYRAFGRPAAMWVGAIAVIGLDPFGWVFMVLRGALGETTGLSDVVAALGTGAGALAHLSYWFPPSHVSLLNRFWTGTALTPAIALGLATAWAVARALERPSRAAWLRTLALALAAFAFHPAYTAITVLCLGAGIAWAMLREERRGVGLGLIVALLLAFAVAIPYVRACTVPGAGTSVHLGIYRRNLLSLLLAVGPWWILAAPAFAAVRSASAAARFCAATAIVTVTGALVLVLPEYNTDKLFYLAWVSLAPLCAAGWVWWGNRLRLPTMARVTLLTMLIVPTAGLYSLGTAVDGRSPGLLIRGNTPAARPLPLETEDEKEGYRFLAERTPDQAVVIEKPRPTVNEPVPVLGERRVFCGSLDVYVSNHFGGGQVPSRPLMALMEEFGVRRGIQHTLFDTGVLDGAQRQYLTGFSAPLYLLVRRSEVTDAVWDGFRAQLAWSEEFANREMRIYRFQAHRSSF